MMVLGAWLGRYTWLTPGSGLACCLLALAMASCSREKDKEQPQTGEPAYSLVVQVAPGIEGYPPSGTLKWSYSSARTFFSPAIGENGWIYVMDHDYKVYALSPEGTLIWTFDDFEYTFVKRDMGQRTPAIDASGVIYVPTEAYTGESKVYAISQDGTLRWKYYVEGSRYVRGSPAIGEDGTIYVATKAVSKAVPARVIALSPSGTEIWHLDIPTIHETPDDIYSSRAVGADGTIYFGCETGKLYAVSSDGVMLWDHMLLGINWSSPAIIGDGTLYVAGIDDGMLYTGALCAVVTTSHGLAP